MLLDLVCLALQILLILVFARILLSWFPLQPGGVAAQVASFLYGVTEPIMGPLRRVLPPVGVGGMGLDLSPIIVIFGIFILQVVLGC